MTEDRRAYKRFDTYLEANCKLPDGTIASAQIINVTPHGLALKTKSRIEVNEKFELEIIFLAGKACFECQVVRAEGIAQENLNKICVKIINGSASDNMLLYQFYAKKKREGN